MRAAQITRLDGPDAVEVNDVDEPQPWGVVIDVEAAGVAFPELLQTRGLYQMKPDLPFVPGAEVAGVVTAAPEGSGFAAGDRVAAHPDQELELRLGDAPALGKFAGAEVRQARPHPETGRSSLLRVVPRQRGRQAPVTIGSRDRAQQVPIPVARTHHPHRDRHADQVDRLTTASV